MTSLTSRNCRRRRLAFQQEARGGNPQLCVCQATDSESASDVDVSRGARQADAGRPCTDVWGSFPGRNPSFRDFFNDVFCSKWFSPRALHLLCHFTGTRQTCGLAHSIHGSEFGIHRRPHFALTNTHTHAL